MNDEMKGKPNRIVWVLAVHAWRVALESATSSLSTTALLGSLSSAVCDSRFTESCSQEPPTFLRCLQKRCAACIRRCHCQAPKPDGERVRQQERESWLPACVLVNLHVRTGCDFGLRSLNGLKQRRGCWRRGKGLFGFDGVSVGSEMKTNTDAKHQNC
jgi:hypothetical protein